MKRSKLVNLLLTFRSLPEIVTKLVKCKTELCSFALKSQLLVLSSQVVNNCLIFRLVAQKRWEVCQLSICWLSVCVFALFVCRCIWFLPSGRVLVSKSFQCFRFTEPMPAFGICAIIISGYLTFFFRSALFSNHFSSTDGQSITFSH